MKMLLQLGKVEDLKPGCDASGWILLGKDLSNRDLSNINFEGAMLANVDFTGSNLTGCNLNKTDLCGTNFTGANLAWAKLRFIRTDTKTKFDDVKNKVIERTIQYSIHRPEPYSIIYCDGNVNLDGIDYSLKDLTAIIRKEVDKTRPLHERMLDFRLDTLRTTTWILSLAKKYLKAYTGNSRVLKFTPKTNKGKGDEN